MPNLAKKQAMFYCVLKSNKLKFSMKTLLLYLFISFQIFAQNAAITGINHVSLSVTDLEKSIGFYKNAIGLEVINRQEIKQQIPSEKAAKIKHKNRKTVTLKGPNGQIELLQFEGINPNSQSKMPVQGSGITHVCYQSPMTNSIYEKSKKLGAKIVSRGEKPIDRGYGIHYAYIKDNDNIMFENEEFEKPKFTENVWLGHVALVTHDIDRLVNFYTQLLDSKPINRKDNIKNNPKLDDIANIDSLELRGAWFQVGNMLLEIWQFDSPKTMPNEKPNSYTEIGYQKIVFDVKNLKKVNENSLKKGIEFLSKPVIYNKTVEVFLRDPDGNLLLLHEKLL